MSQRSPVLVVVNGGPGVSHDYLRPEWDRAAGFAGLVYYDQRGCGRSERRPPYRWQMHVEDLDDVIDRVAGRKRVARRVVVGHVARAALYARAPRARARRRLTGTPPWPDSMAVEYARRELPTTVRAHMDSLDSGFQLAELPFDSATAAARLWGVDPAIVARIGAPCPNAQLESWLSLRTAPPVERLRQITAPVLLMAGSRRNAREDASQSLAHMIRHATVFTIANGGHDPWHDAPDVFFRRLRDFVQGLR